MLKTVIFDFGGVIAEEGFREGLFAIAFSRGIDPSRFFELAREIIYESGYVTGCGDESRYWRTLREKSGIAGTDGEFRQEILSRFILRSDVIACVRSLRGTGVTLAILSDQTDWLDDLDRETPFSHEFDAVFNSYHLGISKRDVGIFSIVCDRLGVEPAEAFFIDDNEGNVERAAAEGLATHLYRDMEGLRDALRESGLGVC